MVLIVECHFFLRLLGPRISHHGAGYSQKKYKSHESYQTIPIQYFRENIHLNKPICLALVLPNLSGFKFFSFPLLSSVNSMCDARSIYFSHSGPRWCCCCVLYIIPRDCMAVVAGWTVLVVWLSRQSSALQSCGFSGIDIWLFHFVLRYRFFTVINI